jgi:hypothetical protein
VAKVGRMFSKIKLDGGSIMAVMGSVGDLLSNAMNQEQGNIKC